MALYYFAHRKERGYDNFGDDLNLWLTPRVIGDNLVQSPNPIVIGIGTLLNDYTVNQVSGGQVKVVFTSGYGYGTREPAFNETWHFYAVRGHITKARLRLQETVPVGDGGLLLQDFVDSSRLSPEYKSDVVFLPHADLAATAGTAWMTACELAGIRYVSPTDDTWKVISAVANARLVITSAMHAAIAADAFRTPWIGVNSYGVLTSKWADWGTAIDLVPILHPVPAIWNADPQTSVMGRAKNTLRMSRTAFCLAGLKRLQGQLSNSVLLASAQAGLRAAADQLREDWT